MSYCYRLVRGDAEINICHVHTGYMGMSGKTGPCALFNTKLVMRNQCLDALGLRLIDMTMHGWRITGDYDHPNGFSAMEFIREIKHFGADPRDFEWYKNPEYPMTIGKDLTHWIDLTGTV